MPKGQINFFRPINLKRGQTSEIWPKKAIWQPWLALASKGAGTSDLQSHHSMTPEQWTWFLCSVSVVPASKVIARNKSIGIELLTSSFLEHFGSSSQFLGRGKCPWFWRTTSSKLFAWVQCKSAPTIVILFALTCSVTMLTSKLQTEIIKNHSELYVCVNSCNKFVSSRSWWIVKFLMILSCKGTCDPVSPLSKVGGQCPP